ncbi:unnamed protein product [Rangifer tarandus platyrhynchus]|uniref:Uncharacterized protein n=2 Tax=Rangifer tarandus platyrhynchus TaxID=3082113 RepID=A0ABN8ZNE0_RANTA|nr:unnamed protein product [Rangifer tarandus platyrhynchus]
MADRGLGGRWCDRLQDVPGSWLRSGARAGVGRGSAPPPGAPQRQDWAAWQVSAASGHASSWGVPAPPALTGQVTLLSALAARLPCPVAQGQPGEGTGRPSGRSPSHRGCGEAGAGLALGGQVPRAWSCPRAPGGQAPYRHCGWGLSPAGGGAATAQDPSPMDKLSLPALTI